MTIRLEMELNNSLEMRGLKQFDKYPLSLCGGEAGYL
jgi:hypothetical protein